MTGFTRILFPVDFSPQSRSVARLVKSMAGHFNAEVTLLHVVDIPHSLRPALAEAGPLHSGARVALEKFAAQEFSGMSVTRELAEGEAAQGIVKFAHEHQISLIMLPTHGYGPFRALLLGSVTAKVLHDAQCPVWTSVHAETMTSHTPDRWKRMLCAIDDTDGSGVPVLKWAAGFAQSQGTDLRLVHAVAGAEAMWTHENDPSMYEFLFHAAREKLAKLQAEAGTSLEIRLVGGSLGAAVRRVALETEADLIITGRATAHRAFERLRNHAYWIIREAPCPVISI